MNRTIQRGAVASFTIGDVVSPDAIAVTRQTGPALAVHGRIVYLSDSGPLKDHFAVIDVDGIHTPLVVPVDRLRIEGAVGENARDLLAGESAGMRSTWRVLNDVDTSSDTVPR